MRETSMAEYTRGPWHLNGMAVESEYQHICWVDDESHDDGDTNARLIAAAPEILKCLSVLVKLDEIQKAGRGSGTIARIIRRCEKAITDATGEPS